MNLKVVIKGLGMIGCQCCVELLKRNIQIVGAVDEYDKIIGIDLGVHIGQKELGIVIEKDLNQVLARVKPDIVILCTKTTLEDISSDIELCILHHANVLTSSEHAYNWKLTNSKIGTKLDQLAKQNKVTICAGGVQDMNWGVIPYALSAMCHHISKIEGATLAMIDDFGPAVMAEAFVGLTKNEFYKISVTKEVPLDAFTISLYTLADKLGLHVIDKQAVFQPVFAKKEMFCKSLNQIIPAGNLIGSTAKTYLKTKENIDLSCAFISKLAEEGDSAYNQWHIEGYPNMSLTIDDMHGEVTTTSCMINRISDVINAASGFITINDLPVPFYKVNTLNSYIQ